MSVKVFSSFYLVFSIKIGCEKYVIFRNIRELKHETDMQMVRIEKRLATVFDSRRRFRDI